MIIDLMSINSIDALAPTINEADLLKMSKNDIMAIEIRLSPNPIAFINKYLFATYLPSHWKYGLFVEVCKSVEHILANEKSYNFKERDIEKLNDISIYFNTLKDYWDNYVSYTEQESGISVEVAFSLAITLHVAILEDSKDTDIIRMIADSQTRPIWSAITNSVSPHIASFHTLHASCLERLQKAWPKYGDALAEVLPFKTH